jgi:hypothetical protein
MKKTLLIAFFCLVANASFTVLSLAQEMPDTIFDNKSQAFGNSVQDVPPDILAVEITPDPPVPGEAIHVSANIRVDPDISKFLVREAFAYYRKKDEITGLKRVSMAKSPDRPGWWEASIPGFEKGTDIEIFIRGIDEIGNEVFQLPAINGLLPKDLIEFLYDGKEDGIPASMDVMSVGIGYDGNDLVSCIRLVVPFQSYSELGADAIVLGFIADDVRVNPTRSVTENTSGFVGWFPAMKLKGIFDIRELSGGGKAGDEASVNVSGRDVCLHAAVNKLTPTPERGVKIYAGTAGLDQANNFLNLGDSSPYAIVYFAGRAVRVGERLP